MCVCVPGGGGGGNVILNLLAHYKKKSELKHCSIELAGLSTT